MQRFLKRVYTIIEPAYKEDIKSKVCDIFILILIVLNVASVILESYSSIYLKYGTILNKFELVSIIIFTIEYILRIITARFKYRQCSTVQSSIKHITSPMAVVDLLAILPFFLPMFVIMDLRFLRILRLTRLLRILKVNRYTNSMKLLVVVLKKKKEELFLTVFVTILMLLTASATMYYVENDAQPDMFPNIIASFWWAVATLTTVGYGDVYPITAVGKLLSGIIALLGIGLVALPTGIISSGFMEEFSKSGDINHKNPIKKHRRVTFSNKPGIKKSRRSRRKPI